jgi:hypothetical protein
MIRSAYESDSPPTRVQHEVGEGHGDIIDCYYLVRESAEIRPQSERRSRYPHLGCRGSVLEPKVLQLFRMNTVQALCMVLNVWARYGYAGITTYKGACNVFCIRTLSILLIL